jgi:dimethylglycine catabolism B
MRPVSRPGLRPMRALPLLETHRTSLEKCVFCPKLCRSACPVSNAEPRETITPWGKMSLAWMTAHGDVPVDASHGHPAWACTGCFACRESCDHRNGVTDVLLDTRDALARRGVLPEGAQRVLTGFARHDQSTRAATHVLAAEDGVRTQVDPGSTEALLVGCGYVRAHPDEARDAIAATASLAAGPVALIEACCGLPLRLAGDAQGFVRHARSLAESLRGKTRLTVVDAGCALTLRARYAEAGVTFEPGLELLVERAAKSLPDLRHVDHDGAPVRWHDPCQLGRGLGLYEAPRAVLGRAIGRAPDELYLRREQGTCSGAGGLLPATMPDVSRDIARARIDAHQHAGGGRVVTGCASSLRSLRKGAVGTGVVVDDLVTWIARSLDISRRL